MPKFHNYRNSFGQFTRRVTRTSDGKFASNVIAGRLYDFKGATVRALKKDDETGLRLVSFHKTLLGYVKDSQLTKVDGRKVQKYLQKA